VKSFAAGDVESFESHLGEGVGKGLANGATCGVGKRLTLFKELGTAAAAKLCKDRRSVA